MAINTYLSTMESTKQNKMNKQNRNRLSVTENIFKEHTSKSGGLPQPTPLPHITATTLMVASSCRGQHWISWTGSPTTSVFSCEVGPLGLGKPAHRGWTQIPFSTTLWRSEKPEECKRAKKRMIQHHLLKNDRKLLCINLLEKCHKYMDA